MNKTLIFLFATLFSFSPILIADNERGTKKERKERMRQEKEMRREKSGGKQGGHFLKILKELNLNETQRAKAKELMAKMQEKQNQVKKQAQELQLKMENEMDKDPLDEDKIISISRDLGEFRAKSRLGIYTFFKSLKQHLEDEQIAKLENIQKEIRAKMKDRMKKMTSKQGKFGKRGNRKKNKEEF